MRVNRVLSICVGALATTLAGGCVVGLDLLNPDALAGIGISPDTFNPPGRIIVAYTNDTDAPVLFQSAAFDALTNPVQNGVVLTVPAGETIGRSLDCPVAAFSPGFALTADGAAELAVFGEAGGIMFSGDDYICGDVIEVRIVQFGQAGEGEAEATFAIRVQVRPGR